MLSIISFLLSFIISPSFGESLLKAASFPATFDDLSFKSQVEFLYDSYAPYDIEYDANGVCVSGCAYKGITLEETMESIAEANAEMANLIENATQNPNLTLGEISGNLETQETPGAPGYESSNSPATDWCHNGLTTKLPLRYPVDMSNLKYKVNGDFGLRPAGSGPNGGGYLHGGLDILTPDNTPVYATADGVVKEVGNQTTSGGGGLYINILHDHGLITQYIHLGKQLVSVGQKVKACDKIALSGHSGKPKHGDKYGPHLDYRVRFASKEDKFVDILCPCKAAYRRTRQGGVDITDTFSSCAHSLFNAPYKFVKYNPNSNETKRSLWRVQWGHCMRNITDLLPDEVK